MRKSKNNRPVVLAISSGGGHWVQMQKLAAAFKGADVNYATTDCSAFSSNGNDPLHFYPDANKTTPLRLVGCILKVVLLVLRIRPDVVISTGAAGGFIAILVARALGARTMFVDSIANARELSISARLSLGVADHVLSQWPSVAAKSGAEYRGAVI